MSPSLSAIMATTFLNDNIKLSCNNYKLLQDNYGLQKPNN